MTDSPTPAPPAPPRRSAARVAAIITGGLLGLISLGILAAGGAALWADGQKDDQGYISTRTDRFHTGTAALRTQNLDIDLGGTGTFLEPSRYGNLRLRVEPRAGNDVFVGIARTRDVDAYLRRTAHATVTDLNYSPFDVTYATTGGTRRAAPPASQRIWEASAHGSGTQTLTWDVADGNWSVVVMNADGSAGVDAGVNAGANVPFLDEVGWGAVGTGALVALLAIALMVAGLRTPSPPRTGTQAPVPAPAA